MTIVSNPIHCCHILTYYTLLYGGPLLEIFAEIYKRGAVFLSVNGDTTTCQKTHTNAHGMYRIVL